MLLMPQRSESLPVSLLPQAYAQEVHLMLKTSVKRFPKGQVETMLRYSKQWASWQAVQLFPSPQTDFRGLGLPSTKGPGKLAWMFDPGKSICRNDCAFSYLPAIIFRVNSSETTLAFALCWLRMVGVLNYVIYFREPSLYSKVQV